MTHELFRGHPNLGERLAGGASTPGHGGERPVAQPEDGRAFKRALGVLIGLAVMIGATYLVPTLHRLRPWAPSSSYVPFWNVVGREWLGEEVSWKAEARALAELKRVALAAPRPSAAAAPRPSASTPNEGVFPPYAPETRVERPAHGIEPNEALDAYFRKLTLVDLGVPFAIARAGHWGDSVLGLDGITSGIRRRLQSRFGDAGLGFHLMDRYHDSYKQQGIDFIPGKGWRRCFIVQGCTDPARRYGYGGLTVHSTPGSSATWTVPKQSSVKTVSSFEFWFAYQERGGSAEIIIDNDWTLTVDTRGPHLHDGWELVYLPQGARSFTVRALGGVRAYGVVLENEGPGVVWDGISLIAGSTRALRTQDADHVKRQIGRRALDLVVFTFGGNDLQRNYVDLRDSMEPYYEEYGEVLRKFRAAKSDLPCLIMSLTDHGKRVANGEIVSVAFGKRLAQAQREVARRNGCAFFDTYEAIGGTGTAARWFRARPRLISPDLGHPNGLGHELIAGLVANALLYGYQDYRLRSAGKPFPELAAGLALRGAAAAEASSSDAAETEDDAEEAADVELEP